MFQRIAVFGLGLLGGALCRGMKKNDAGVRITAYGRDRKKLEPALRGGFVDDTDVIDRMDLRGVDLAVVATPVISSIGLIERILGDPALGDGAIVIDVGSVKGPVVEAALRCPRADRFIGCHPMAGSEKTGFMHSDASLYEGSQVIVTPHELNRAEDLDAVASLWRSLGAKVSVVSPETHDFCVSHTSHLPHVLSAALAGRLMKFSRGGEAPADLGPFIGNGFRDTTRIAAGSPEMWRDIVLANRENIRTRLAELGADLERFMEIIDDGDALYDYFSEIKRFRDGIK